MPTRPPNSRRIFDPREPTALTRALLRWILLGAWVGLLSGCASAVFLHALTWATEYREVHPFLLFGLPLAGYAVGLAYDRWGGPVAGGNNLLLERIHSGEATAIPFRLVPLVLLGTVITHLFGGSAGREGTAVQMGGTLANLATTPLKMNARDHRMLIMSGISGGFGAVFGTPLAGTVFGLEVLTIGRVGYEALIPCFVSAIVGDVVCRGLGVHHSAYHVPLPAPTLTPALWAWILAASVLFALAAALFSELTEAITHFLGKRIAKPALRPVLGGIAVIALTYLVGSREYLGLSLPLIARSFTPEGVAPWAFAFKLLFTAVTLGSGFKGGEVTPLFAIGATLGAAFAHLTGQPQYTAFFAALGFVAVFGGAANTPIACALMGIELFGSEMGIPLFAACLIAYVLSGHRGIYGSQRIGVPKAHDIIAPNRLRLREARNGRLRYANRREKK